MAVTEMEERLTRLEAEVEALKRKRAESDAAQKPWWEDIRGTFKDDAAYVEAARLGREWRQSQGMAGEEPAL